MSRFDFALIVENNVRDIREPAGTIANKVDEAEPAHVQMAQAPA